MTVGPTLSLFYLVALVLLIPNIRVSYSVQAELGEQHEHDGQQEQATYVAARFSRALKEEKEEAMLCCTQITVYGSGE